MQNDRLLMPLAIINIQTRSVKQAGFEPGSSRSRLPIGHCQCDFLRWKQAFAQSLYWLKLEIAHSWPGNLRGEIIVYIPAHVYLIKYLDVVWGVANCNTTQNNLPLLHSTNNIGCKISIKHNIADSRQTCLIKIVPRRCIMGGLTKHVQPHSKYLSW